MTSRFMQIFSLKTSLDNLCENTEFHLPVFSRMRTESATMFLYGRIRVGENPYSHVFHEMYIANKNIGLCLPHFLQ